MTTCYTDGQIESLTQRYEDYQALITAAEWAFQRQDPESTFKYWINSSHENFSSISGEDWKYVSHSNEGDMQILLAENTNTGEYVFLTPGDDGSAGDAFDDLILSGWFGTGETQGAYKLASWVIEQQKEYKIEPYNIKIVGHSLGAIYAQQATKLLHAVPGFTSPGLKNIESIGFNPGWGTGGRYFSELNFLVDESKFRHC